MAFSTGLSGVIISSSSGSNRSGLDGPRERAGGHWPQPDPRVDDSGMEPAVAHRTRSESRPSLSQVGDGTGVGDRAASIPGAIRRLLLATDLSAASERAADEAINLALESGAQLVVLSVIDPGRLSLPGGRILRRVDQERSRIETGIQMLVSRALAAGVRAAFLIWEGDPAESILAAAEAENVDVIVLGSHRRGLLGRLILGSTSARVSEQAKRRVLVVPR
jgi:nucleotide-binding universal stress UspA family protein